MTDPFVGQLAFFRVYSGKLNTGSYVYNSTKQRRERVGRLLKMHANKREEIKDVFAGDIAAAVGLRNVTTGDTICDENKQILLEAMDFPEPVISVAIEPKTKADQEKMGIALSKLAQEDPTFHIHTDPDTEPDDHFRNGRTPPGNHRRPHDARVQCRRQCRQAAGGLQGNDPAEGRCRRQVHPQTGGHGQYGHVRITVEPSGVGAGFVFENDIIGGSDPARIHQARRAGNQGSDGERRSRRIRSQRREGHACIDGSYHEVDSSEIAFKIAGSMAFKDGCRKASPALLEPVMKVEVVLPEEYMGDVIGDLNSRRGRIEGMEARPGTQIITALVPLSSMFGYATDLAFANAGPRDVHDAFRALRRSAEEYCRRNYCQSTGPRSRGIGLTHCTEKKRIHGEREI